MKSAGILFFRKTKNSEIQVLLVHPGGPFWAKKDEGAWSIPKGELQENEDPLLAAKREIKEEIGVLVEGEMIPLRPIKQKSGKEVLAWAMEMEIDCSSIKSNFFELEWPPRSGKKKMFPEIDKAEWFSLENARKKVIAAQISLLEQLENLKK